MLVQKITFKDFLFCFYFFWSYIFNVRVSAPLGGRAAHLFLRVTSSLLYTTSLLTFFFIKPRLKFWHRLPVPHSPGRISNYFTIRQPTQRSNFWKFFLARKRYDVIDVRQKFQFSLLNRVFLRPRSFQRLALGVYFSTNCTSFTTQTQLVHWGLRFNFYKHVTKRWQAPKQFKLIFSNIHKPFLRLMRGARYVYWDLDSRGTLNKRRYEIFLRKKVTALQAIPQRLNLLFYGLQQLGVLMSLQHLTFFVKYGLLYYNGSVLINKVYLRRGDIIECITGPYFWNWYLTLEHFAQRYQLKTQKWAHRAQLSMTDRIIPLTARLPIKCPKFLKTNHNFNSRLLKYFSNDFVANACCIIQTLPASVSPTKDILFTNSMLRLTRWRYKA